MGSRVVFRTAREIDHALKCFSKLLFFHTIIGTVDSILSSLSLSLSVCVYHFVFFFICVSPIFFFSGGPVSMC